MDKKIPENKKKIELPKTVGREITDPAFPIVTDPPVPNRAHTEMIRDFPPEFPDK